MCKCPAFLTVILRFLEGSIRKEMAGGGVSVVDVGVGRVYDGLAYPKQKNGYLAVVKRKKRKEKKKTKESF